MEAKLISLLLIYALLLVGFVCGVFAEAQQSWTSGSVFPSTGGGLRKAKKIAAARPPDLTTTTTEIFANTAADNNGNFQMVQSSSSSIIPRQRRQRNRKLSSTSSSSSSNSAVNFPIQTFFIPLPEESMYYDMFQVINAEKVAPGVISLISVAISLDNTVIFYDHWEDGYDHDVTKDAATTTRIWGDGNAENGCPPHVTSCTNETDKLMAGDTFVIQNEVELPRDPVSVKYDGRDRLQASLPVTVTRGGYPKTPGSKMAGAVEVLDTDQWGKFYEAPVGQDIGKSMPAWEFSAFCFMAMYDNTRITLPINDTEIVLNRGETSMVRINHRDRLVADKKIQVDLVTGDIDSVYEFRWYSMVAVEDYSNHYVTPVGDSVGKTKVMLYNPNSKKVDITMTYLENGAQATVVKTLEPRRPMLSNIVPTASGAFFTSEDKFIGLSLTDTEFTTSTGQQTGGQFYDWGFSLFPTDQLTDQVLIGWGYGCTNQKCEGLEDRSVIWVTPVANADIYVDYENIGTNYTVLSAMSLTSSKITDPNDHDMSGAFLFATESGKGPDGPPVVFAAAWGQDPAVSRKKQRISLDLGTAVVPFQPLRVNKIVDKETTFPGDKIRYTIRIINAGHADVEASTLTLTDMLDKYATYIPGSFKVVQQDNQGNRSPATSLQDDTHGSTDYPLDEGGINVTLDIARRGGILDYSFEAIVDTAEHIQTDRIDNKGFLHDGKRDWPFEAVAFVQFTPNVQIKTRVYQGNDNGSSCEAADESHTGFENEEITMCYTVTNHGDTLLKVTSVEDATLSFSDNSIGVLKPGESATVHMLSVLTDDMQNEAVVLATPVYASGDQIPNLGSISHTTGSIVRKLDLSASIQVNSTVYLGNDGGASCGTEAAVDQVEGKVGSDVTYCFFVKNTGDAHLSQVALEDKVIDFRVYSQDILGPGATATVHYTRAIMDHTINHVSVSAYPVTSTGEQLPEYPQVISTDSSEVVKIDYQPSIEVTSKVYKGQGATCSSETVFKTASGLYGDQLLYCLTITNTGETFLSHVVVKETELNFSDTDSVGVLPPGNSVTIHYSTTIASSLVADFQVTAVPSNSFGVATAGEPVSHTSDSIRITKFATQPKIEIENTVYTGTDFGETCDINSLSEIEATEIDTIVYCFEVKNRGDSYLWNVTLTDPQLNYTDKSIRYIAPGASKTVAFIANLNEDTTNNIQVAAKAGLKDGTAIPDTSDISASDSSFVKILKPAENNGEVKTGDKDTYTLGNYTSAPSQCMQDNFQAAQNQEELVCASKEVYLDSVSSQPKTCRLGETVTVSVDASIHISSSRYDVGWYVATDGGDSLTGACSVSALREGNPYKVVASPGSSVTAGSVTWLDEFESGNDNCGDVYLENTSGNITSGNIQTPIMVDQSIICSDENEDGALDFAICWTWHTYRDGLCDIDVPSTIIPGAADSCFCTRYDVQEITVTSPDDPVIEPCR